MIKSLPLGYVLGQEISREGADVFTAYAGEIRRVVKSYQSPKNPGTFWDAMNSQNPGDALQAQLDRDTAHWRVQKQGHPHWMPLLETAIVPRPSGLGWTIYEYMPQLVELEEHLDFCPPTEETYLQIAQDILTGLLEIQKKGATHGGVAPEHIYFDGKHYVLGGFSSGTADDAVGWGKTMTWLLHLTPASAGPAWLRTLASWAEQEYPSLQAIKQAMDAHG